MQTDIKLGDNVTFDADQVDVFTQETNGDNPELKKYQMLVLAGVNQVGVVKAMGPGENLTTVSYPDGWDLPIPTKYLVVLPKI